MERLKIRGQDAQRALDTLDEILQDPYSVKIRDATIQRFEYTFEAFWKYAREYLKAKQGIVANSPKLCFRELFSVGIIDEERSVLFQEMTDRRNETAHTYKEEVAEKIFREIPSFSKAMGQTLAKLL